jgi:RNA polymerase sigma-70 factor (ECF subfamily)
MLETGERAAVMERPGVSTAEAALIQAGLAGDRAALEQLLAPHELALIAFCYGILGHAEDAEDAAQETIVRALRALASFRGEAAFRSWLFQIALHLCLRWKSRRHPTEVWDEEKETLASRTTTPEELALNHLRLLEALDRLPPQRRAVLLLKEWEGRNMMEIGQMMGWSRTRVKNELYKARRALVEWQRQETGEGDEP